MHYALPNDKRLLHRTAGYSAAMSSPNERLRKAREAMFTSAAEAARSMNIPEGTYAGHENGHRGFPASRAPQYARKFKVTEEWLLFGKPAVEAQEEEPRTLLLSVSLPNHDRLTRMMRGLLRGVGLADAVDLHAEELARRLPDALAIAASDIELAEIDYAASPLERKERGSRHGHDHS